VIPGRDNILPDNRGPVRILQALLEREGEESEESEGRRRGNPVPGAHGR
jgi:hypothetical protein